MLVSGWHEKQKSRSYYEPSDHRLVLSTKGSPRLILTTFKLKLHDQRPGVTLPSYDFFVIFLIYASNFILWQKEFPSSPWKFSKEVLGGWVKKYLEYWYLIAKWSHRSNLGNYRRIGHRNGSHWVTNSRRIFTRVQWQRHGVSIWLFLCPRAFPSENISGCYWVFWVVTSSIALKTIFQAGHSHRRSDEFKENLY